ncbi:hypothetical protein C8R43DRAFT_280771 [Mycena crocata]|nr:hypothetical protein C8R43DRAFT_280771 [Mycena crocata]
MLRRFTLACKLENSIPSQQPYFVQSFTPPPCRFTPLLHSLTCIRYTASYSAAYLTLKTRNYHQDHRNRFTIPSAEPQPLPNASRDPFAEPSSPPREAREALLQLFLTVQQNASVLKRIRKSPHLLEYMLDPIQIHGLLDDLATSKIPKKALIAINTAHKLGSTMGLDVYETVVTRLSTLKEWELVLTVIRSCKHNTHQTTPALLDWRARALLETKSFTELNRIFDLYEANNLLPSRRTWHLVLSGFIRNHDLEGARECLVAMENAGFRPNHSTHALIGQLYQTIGADGQVKDRAIASLPHISVRRATHTMNSLMHLRLRIYDLDEVFYLLSAFDQSKVGPLALMLAASKAQREDPDENAGVDSSRLGHGSFPLVVEPDAITFAMFIDHFAFLHQLPRCLTILDQMQLAGIAPTPRTVVSMIRAYFLAHQGGAAVRLVASMCDPETTTPEMLQNLPSSVEYTPPLDTAGMGPPTRSIFNTLLREVLRTHGLTGGRAILRLMRANHVRPDSRTSEILASHAHKVEGVQPRMVMRIIRRLNPYSNFTLQQAHVVLSATLRFQKFLVDGVGWNVTAAKYSPTRTAQVKHTPAEFISGVAPNFDPLAGILLPKRARQRGTFRAIEQSLAVRGVKSDQATIALRIRQDAVVKGDMNSATDIFQTLLSRGMHPNAYHYSALMEGFAKAGDFESAVEVMRAATRASIEPSVVMFTILIVGYARRREPEMALRIFRRMVAAGIKPDVPAIDAVASAFFFVGAYGMCWRVLTSLWQHISPLPPGIDQTSLKSGVLYFRSLHRGQEQGLKKKASKEYRTTLYRALAELFREWRDWQQNKQEEQSGRAPRRHRKPHVDK